MKIKSHRSSFRMFLLLVGIVFLPSCNVTGIINLQSGNILATQKWSGESNNFTVPFEWHDGHPIINLSVNGQPNLRFALDSGAAATVLFQTPNTEALNLDIEMQLDLQGANVNVVNNTVIIVGDIQLSEMTIIHVPLDQSPLFGSADEAYFDGAIGFDLLSRFQVKINYANTTVTFYKNGLANLPGTDWVRLPMTVLGRVPHVSAALYNKDDAPSIYLFTVDTGAPDYLYINSALAEGLTFPTEFFQSTSKNFEGEFTLNTSRVDVFKLGNTVFENIAIHDLPNFEDDNGIGLLGSGLLRNFDVIFDYKNEYIALKKNIEFTTKTNVDRSGLQLEPHTKGALVKYLAIETNAIKLGIMQGDVVTQINNQKINAANFDELRALLGSNVPDIKLCWLSANQERCDVLRLQDRI